MVVVVVVVVRTIVRTVRTFINLSSYGFLNVTCDQNGGATARSSLLLV